MPWRYSRCVDWYPVPGTLTGEQYAVYYDCLPMIWEHENSGRGFTGGLGSGERLVDEIPVQDPPDNVDWDAWFDNMRDHVDNLREDMIGSTRDDIPWSPPVDPPKDKEPTDPIDKDPGPDDYIPPDHFPYDAPCGDCEHWSDYPPGDGRGSVFKYTSKYGTRYIDTKVYVNGRWVDNPELAKVGLVVNGNGCECQNAFGPDDFDSPPPGTPSDPDCEKSVKDFLKNFPDIDGCDKATKKRITKAMYDACVAANKMTSSQQFSDLYNATWRAGLENESVRQLLNCMINPDRLSMIKKLKCGKVAGKPGLTGMELAYSDTDTGEIIIDFQGIDAYLNTSGNSNVPKDEFVSFVMSHELLHHCCKHAKTTGFDTDGNQIGVDIKCAEGDIVFLNFLLSGDKIWNRPTTSEIDDLCLRGAYMKSEFSKQLVNANKPPLGPNWIISGNFLFNVITGDIYMFPLVFDANSNPIGNPLTTITPPPGGYNLCP